MRLYLVSLPLVRHVAGGWSTLEIAPMHCEKANAFYMKTPTTPSNRFFPGCMAFIACCLLLSGVCDALPVGSPAPAVAVAFPGPEPGTAQALQTDGLFTLENGVIAASWRFTDTGLRPVNLVNKLTGTRFDQGHSELFRLATTALDAKLPEGVGVTVRLDADKVIVLVSRDGLAWRELAAFPRAQFPGEPKLVRIGKMNMRAEARDNPGDTGPVGQCGISELVPKPISIPNGRFEMTTNAHKALVSEYPFPTGKTFVSCRIDKGSDQGMTWGPALALVWEEGKRFLLVGVRDKNPTFNISTADGERIVGAKLDAYPAFDLPASALRWGAPAIVSLHAEPAGVRLADRIGGMAIEAEADGDRGLHVRWHAELRDGSNYIRQTIELTSHAETIGLAGVELVDLRAPGLATIGNCPGCPVAGSGLFAGVEIPGAQNAVGPIGAHIGFACKLEVSPKQPYSFGAVVGVWPEGQLRRSFLFYIERERARPSKPFLHYNCWFDLGYGVDEKGIVDVVTRFNDELVTKRGVPVSSYLIDDGWDDVHRGLWAENLERFPGGFSGLKARMDKSGAHLGIWISPLGGYGGDKERTELARKMGLIPETAELDLSYPAYKQWFQDRCLQLMREAGVNIFKWDKAGEGVSPHFMALLDVAGALRRENPDVFINVTVGTWPSPFWLNHVDTTWRNGSADVGWAGKGNDPKNVKYDREKWLTFRDGNCRRYFVEMSPLYPLNSAMHHGIVHGRNFQGKDVGSSGPDLKHEARSYFANGAMLQELYLTPSMMTPGAWDSVAEAAKWARANADVLVDAHWVGGDPLKLEAYGYAAWNRRKGTLMLRNPDDKPQTISIDAASIFELPAGAPTRYLVASPYADAPAPLAEMLAGKPCNITLQPFEVLVLEMTPLQ
jgi:hypothetical protein